MKRTFLILICVLFVLALSGCKEERIGLEDYTVYTSKDCESWESEAARTLIEKIKENHGVELTLTHTPSETSIVIGKTFLSEKEQKLFDYEEMGDMGYSVRNSEQQYIITANNGFALKEAISYFVSNIITDNREMIKECSCFIPGNSFEADVTKHINVKTEGEQGCNIYTVPAGIEAGYRYGPSFIVNDDGTIDAWFASGGSGTEQWDWIVYKHFDGGEWSEEKCVLQPTPNALDHYSCCDPGVIYINGYYYLGYTSTLNENQADNNLFVARSKDPDGPYEKWNGSGWGGNDPRPLVYFSEDQSLWGIGEASFVELDGTLYIYYTVSGTNGHCTAVATADATDENWPLTMKKQGYALTNTTSDAIDVKYVDEYKRFIAVATDERLTKDSYAVFYESLDGLSFEITDICKKDIYEYCHNPGLSGNANGHILPGMETFISYAYGPKWGVWNTYFQPVEISLGDKTDTSELNEENRVCINLERDYRSSESLDFVGISSQTQCVMRVPSDRRTLTLFTVACNTFHNSWRNLFMYRDEVKLYGYDESIIRRTNDYLLEFEILGVGETMVTVEFRGHITYVCIVIYEAGAEGKVTDLKPLGCDTYNISALPGERYEPQIKSLAFYDNGEWEMIWSCSQKEIEYEYDKTKLTIDENSHMIPLENGSHKVTVKYGGKSYELTVNVALPDLSKQIYTKTSGCSNLVCRTNNTELTVTDNEKLLCKASSWIDPYIVIDYKMGAVKTTDHSSLTLKYMIPEANKQDSYEAQIFFKCNDAEFDETSSQRVSLIKDGKYHEVTLGLSDKDYWQGYLKEIRIDYFDSCKKEDSFYIESITLNK